MLLKVNAVKTEYMIRENGEQLSIQVPFVNVNVALGIATPARLSHSDGESPEAGEVKRSLPGTCSARPAEPFRRGKPDPQGNAQIINLKCNLLRAKMVSAFAFCILLLHLNGIAQKAAKPIRAVSYTHLTLPTNREV